VADKPWPADSVERRQISELIPYVNNARTHSDAQVAQIAASMKEWGWTNPVLVDEDGMIIAGHGRIMAAQKLGFADAPVMVAKGWTKAQKKAYVLADNQLALNAGWNADILKVELSDLKDLDFDLDLLGFENLDALVAEPTEGLTDEDAVPDVPTVPVTVEGDVWLLGRHRLMCGDSTSIDAVERLMDGIKPNAIFTDPPYGIGLDKEGQKLGKSNAYGAVVNDHNGQAAKDAFHLCAAMGVPEMYFWAQTIIRHASPTRLVGSFGINRAGSR
jgi:hypothetical protein